MLPTSVGIVVALYDEDCTWIQEVLAHFSDPPIHLYVYCKHSDRPLEILEGNPRVTLARLPNVGREADTYLHHILTHYDGLEDVTVFLQGNPLDHMKGEPVTQVIAQWISDAFHTGFSHNLICCTHCGTDYDWDLTTYRDTQLEDEEGLCYGAWFEKYIGIPHPPLVYWYCGAQFAVHKNLLHQRSKESYAWVRSSLQPFRSPKTAHFMERSWAYLAHIHRMLLR